MRVIGGELRRRRLKSLPGPKLRPTPDRLRETLFDVLGARIEGAVFLDAYAGSGAVGIEALSRGAARAIFLEKHRRAAAVIRENLAALGLEARGEVVHGEALKRLPMHSADIVFLDPPYEEQREYHAALRLLGGSAPPLVVAQHSVRMVLDDRYGALERVRLLRQGDNALSFYKNRDSTLNHHFPGGGKW
jgi:16S rRNA (guanine(966)-N(2))-methyltransferase RsmD